MLHSGGSYVGSWMFAAKCMLTCEANGVEHLGSIKRVDSESENSEKTDLLCMRLETS